MNIHLLKYLVKYYVLVDILFHYCSCYHALLVSDHPNKEQYDQYEQQWRQYEEQMSQKREYIQSRKQALLESQRQGQAAAAASQPAVAQPHGSAASAPSSAVATGTDASSAVYGAPSHPAAGGTIQPGYPYPGSGNAAGQGYPVPELGFDGRMPFHPAAPRPAHMHPSVPGGQRFPLDPSMFPTASPGARHPVGFGEAVPGGPSENKTGFEQYGVGENSVVRANFSPAARLPFKASGIRPPFGQQFSGPPRPRPPNEVGAQVPFQSNQPRPGFRMQGPRHGFGPRPDMYVEGGETPSDMGDGTELGDQTAGVPSSQFGPGSGVPGSVRGVRPPGPRMGPRPGFLHGPRPVGMMPRQQAPGFLEETDENAEESEEWQDDGMQAPSVSDFGPRGMRLDGPRFPTPASGFPGRGVVRGPRPRAGDPRMMLHPGDPRAVMRGGMPPGHRPPWLASFGRGAPQWGQNFEPTAADEKDAENEAAAEEDVGDDNEEWLYGDEATQDFEQEDGFGNTGFGSPGLPRPPFGARPPGFGMRGPRFDMRGPRPPFGPRGPGFGAEMRPRAGPVPLMDIRLSRPPLPPQAASKEGSEMGQEDEDTGNAETEELSEDTENRFAEQADVAGGVGARMPFRPPFPAGPRGFLTDQRFRSPGSMLGAPRRGMLGGRWPRPGFGGRLPAPGFRGPMPRFPRMPGDSERGFHLEGGGFGPYSETGFGDELEEDYNSAEAEQWSDEQSQLMRPGAASDVSAEWYAISSLSLLMKQ